MSTRKCHQCGLEKPLDEFGQRSRGGFRDRCRECRAEYMRKRRTRQRQVQAERTLKHFASGARQARRRWSRNPEAAANYAVAVVMSAVDQLGGPWQLIQQLADVARTREGTWLALALLELQIVLAPREEDLALLDAATLRRRLQKALTQLVELSKNRPSSAQPTPPEKNRAGLQSTQLSPVPLLATNFSSAALRWPQRGSYSSPRILVGGFS